MDVISLARFASFVSPTGFYGGARIVSALCAHGDRGRILPEASGPIRLTFSSGVSMHSRLATRTLFRSEP